MGVARVNYKKMGMKDVMPEPSSTLSINLKKHDGMEGNVGDVVTFKGRGIIKSVNKDEYGHSQRMEVTKLLCCDKKKEDSKSEESDEEE